MEPLDGLWTAEFGSTTGISGGGVVIFTGSKILGGDGAYYYEGSFRLDGMKITADVTAHPFDSRSSSIFSTTGRPLKLGLVGDIVGNTILAQGTLQSSPIATIGVKLTKRV
jgi:hypothetical protein